MPDDAFDKTKSGLGTSIIEALAKQLGRFDGPAWHEGVDRPRNIYLAAAYPCVTDRFWEIGDAANVLEGAEKNTR